MFWRVEFVFEDGGLLFEKDSWNNGQMKSLAFFMLFQL